MSNPAEVEALSRKIKHDSAFLEKLYQVTGQVIVGQQHMLDRLLIGLLTKGHILLEGMPGLAKTLAIKTLAQAVDAQFSRIQFTPDLLPADVLGTQIYNPGKGEFTIRKGPIFANFVLADEINRAPAKVQSALLEAMQERQVTIGNETFRLDEPFLVLATQNPIEQEGTYPLPEAQVDRFLLKVKIDYPSPDEERGILRRYLNGEEPEVHKVVSVETLLRAREAVNQIYLDEKVEQYILDIVLATRAPERFNLGQIKPMISYGASPRATLALARSARAMAFLNHRAFVTPDDVRAICPDVLRHRIGLTYEAEAENLSQEDIVARILGAVVIP
ncbi:MAG TPA: MoxR family ATPase [Saprospiraceae bacterium]|nr:MoxR family ATPase [Saprospiraceae bacterium]HNM24686.1 MoxR family ATPase [Saprospiraceae bacterium]